MLEVTKAGVAEFEFSLAVSTHFYAAKGSRTSVGTFSEYSSENSAYCLLTKSP